MQPFILKTLVLLPGFFLPATSTLANTLGEFDALDKVLTSIVDPILNERNFNRLLHWMMDGLDKNCS